MPLLLSFKKSILAVMLTLLALPALATPQLLLDLDSGEVLYEYDAGRPWHPASLTKLMTAYVAFEAIAAGRVNLNTPVIISAHALAAPPSKIGAPVDTAYALKDALYLLIVKSANDIAIAIAETVAGSEQAFVDEMNLTARVLGMNATNYINPNGLHEPGQVTSARDLAVLTLNIRHRHSEYATMFATQSVRLGKARLRSQNNLLTHFAGTTGMKTGYVCASGLNMVATAKRDGRELVAVVLGSVSGRERGELAADLFLGGFSGTLRSRGKLVSAVLNTPDAPLNMRPYICGTEAKSFVAQREAAYPNGLEGQVTHLTDTVEPRIYSASSMGRVRQVPIPRPRPLWAPGARVDAPKTVPHPRPRPATRVMLRAGLL